MNLRLRVMIRKMYIVKAFLMFLWKALPLKDILESKSILA